MKLIYHKLLPLVVAIIIFTGCNKNSSNFYNDGENEVLAIFSNTTNNVLSCYINDNVWRTIDRTYTGFSPRPVYEVTITKIKTNNNFDSLVIIWEGYFVNAINSTGTVQLTLPIAKNYSYKNLNELKGQRLYLSELI